MPALVRFECLGPFFNRLAADDKYSRRNMMNLQQQLQTALSQKQNNFSAIFIAFIKPTLNLEHFDQKCESYSFSISEIIDSEEVVTWTSKTPCFRTPFGNQRVHEFLISTVFGTREHVDCRKVFWSKAFWTFK